MHKTGVKKIDIALQRKRLRPLSSIISTETMKKNSQRSKLEKIVINVIITSF